MGALFRSEQAEFPHRMPHDIGISTAGNLQTPSHNLIWMNLLCVLARSAFTCRYWNLIHLGIPKVSNPLEEKLKDCYSGDYCRYSHLWRSGKSRKMWGKKLVFLSTDHIFRDKARLHQFNPFTLQSIPRDVLFNLFPE